MTIINPKTHRPLTFASRLSLDPPRCPPGCQGHAPHHHQGAPARDVPALRGLQVQRPHPRLRRRSLPSRNWQKGRLRPHGEHRRAVRVVRARVDAVGQRPAVLRRYRLLRQVQHERRIRARQDNRSHRGLGVRPPLGGSADGSVHPDRRHDRRRSLPPHLPQGQAGGARGAVRAPRGLHRGHGALQRRQGQEGEEGLSVC